jgi:hypothetical protein
MKALTHRYAAVGTVFAAAALVTGVPLLRGMACLLSFLLASVVVTVFQRRKHAEVAAKRARRRRASVSQAPTKIDNAKPPKDTRPERSTGAGSRPPYDDEISGYGWPVRDALER